VYENLKTTSIDHQLENNELIPIDNYSLRVIHTPSHSRGHICLYEEESQILFAGDMVMEKGTPIVGSLPGQYGDMTDFLNSLQRLKNLKINRLLQSHGKEIADPYRRIEETIQSKLERERELLQVLEKGEQTFLELVNAKYGEKNISPYFAYSITSAYLEKLRKEGRIKKENDRYKLV